MTSLRHFQFSKPKVKEQLLSHGLQLEEFGGDVQAVEISALTVSGTMGNLPWATYEYIRSQHFSQNEPSPVASDSNLSICDVYLPFGKELKK